MEPAARIPEVASRHGLYLAGVSPLRLPDEALERFSAWRSLGFAGEMNYLRSGRRDEIAEITHTYRSIASFAVAYARTERPARPDGYGRIARYAWGRDYHRILKRRVAAVVRTLEGVLGRRIQHHIFCDATPLMERIVAADAGIGVIGKNNMLLVPGKGSFVLLAEVLWDLAAPDAGRGGKACGRCCLCRTGCPTGALVDDYLLDARRCISYLTIEKRGNLSWDEREAIGEWVFGCDECQEVCPYNRASGKHGRAAELEEFSPAAGPGPLLDLNAVLALSSQEAFLRRFAGTALVRTGRAGLLRNAAAVAANTGAAGLSRALSAAAAGDPDATVRQHALWALVKLYKECNMCGAREIVRLMERAREDQDPAVRTEAQLLLQSL